MIILHILTERPTVPRPKMTTVDPCDISATFHAAPRPECSLRWETHSDRTKNDILKLNQCVFEDILFNECMYVSLIMWKLCISHGRKWKPTKGTFSVIYHTRRKNGNRKIDFYIHSCKGDYTTSWTWFCFHVQIILL